MDHGGNNPPPFSLAALHFFDVISFDLLLYVRALKLI